MIVRFKGFTSHASALPNETILDVARRAAIPLANSCGAVGVCGRCRVQVLTGSENLSPPTSIETRFGTIHKFAADERMACQAVPQGECEVTTTYW
jgi:ferredoxin